MKSRGKYNIIIKIPEYNRKLIMGGKQTTISRHTRHGYVGDRFRVGEHWFEITKMEEMTVADVMENHYRSEGMVSPAEFKRQWELNHPRSRWNPDGVVFLHHIKKVMNGHDVGVGVGDSFRVTLIKGIEEN